MEEIKELDFGKYLVLKREDIENELSPRQKVNLESMKRIIGKKRIKKGKHIRSSYSYLVLNNISLYLVLNIDDDIDLAHLNIKITDLIHNRMLAHIDLYTSILKDVVNQPVKVLDIAVDIVNAILRQKGEEIEQIKIQS